LLLAACGVPPTMGAPVVEPSAAVAPTGGSMPDFDRIDYQHPERYLELYREVGDAGSIRALAAQIGGTTPRERLVAIRDWMEANLESDRALDDEWRSFEQIVASGKFGSCADHAVVFGSLARASGIPTVWVKSLDADFIREFQRTNGRPKSWRGHVFLEVFLEGEWALVDASAGKLYEDYDPRGHILPGDRYAYDKGDNPYALILSLRWQRWRLQTVAWIQTFDTSHLPAAGDARPLRTLGPAWVVASAPTKEWLAEVTSALGFGVKQSFDSDFESYLPQSAGQTLIIAVVGGARVLPDAHWPGYTGITVEELEASVAKNGTGVFGRDLADGTRSPTDEKLRAVLERHGPSLTGPPRRRFE
jgi:transglutaminase-like putative cysteine protease